MKPPWNSASAATAGQASVTAVAYWGSRDIQYSSAVLCPAGGALCRLDMSAEVERLLKHLGQCLIVSQPFRVPGFGFEWLELANHRRLTPSLLADLEGPAGSILLPQSFTATLCLRVPYLRSGELAEHVRLLYNGAWWRLPTASAVSAEQASVAATALWGLLKLQSANAAVCPAGGW